jgi:uncharacterized protein YjiS (DUF1127 family)
MQAIEEAAMAPHVMRTSSPRVNADLVGKGAAAGRRRGGILAGLFDGLAGWAERRRQRNALHALDDALLRDIGLSRADVEREATKPFWMI